MKDLLAATLRRHGAPRGPKPPPAEVRYACSAGFVPQDRQYSQLACGHMWKINNHGCAIAHHELRLAKTRETERPSAVPSKTRARACRVAFGPRRFRLADAFGTTFWCQKVVNPLLAGNAKEKVRNGSEAHSCRPNACQNVQLLLRLCKLRRTALRTPSDCSGYFPASSGACSFAAAIFCRLISLAASLSRRR